MIKNALNALRNPEQCDMDGVLVKISRQTLDVFEQTLKSPAERPRKDRRMSEAVELDEADLGPIIRDLKRHVVAIQTAKRATCDGTVLLAAINDLPMVVRRLEAAEFAINEELEEHEDAILSALRGEQWQGIKTALADVAAERRRQVAVEGWTPEHDDKHGWGELARAAAWYALNSVYRGPETLGVSDPDCEANKLFATKSGHGAYQWPWSMDWWKPSGDRRRDLVKAGALILAEIERLDRSPERN